MNKSKDLMTDVYRTRMMEAICKWMNDLRDYPGWREWNRGKLWRIWSYDAMDSGQTPRHDPEFTFSDEVAEQHPVIMRYLELMRVIDALKECEFYFRRYPFRDLPVTRSNHLANICEMYFSRCYQFKERLKEYFEAVKNVVPTQDVDTVKDFATNFFKVYEREFKEELKARNLIHHNERFEDIEITRIALKEALYGTDGLDIEPQDQLNEYRKATKYWVQRVRVSGVKMDACLECLAELTLEYCKFLSDTGKSTNRTPD